ncbi:MAG: YjiH family protein [Stomatobaculum sp.]
MEKSKISSLVQFTVFSAIGVFMFFARISLDEYQGIPIDLITTMIIGKLGTVGNYLALALVALGTLWPFVKKTWKRSTADMIFTGFKIWGLLASVMVVINQGPAIILAADNGPYLFNSLVKPTALMILIGAPLLCLLVNYGFVDFIGVFVRPITRILWKTPGRSAVDAVSSFVGSTSMGLLFTNQMYVSNKYNTKEASIIATGFTTVAISFMVIVANVLGLSDYWLRYFFVTLLITFMCTAVTCRIYPLSRKPETYYERDKAGGIEENGGDQLFKLALKEAIRAVEEAGDLFTNMKSSLLNGMNLLLEFVPLLMGIGLAALILAAKTPVFEWFGYIFLPLTKVVAIPDAARAAQGVGMGLAEMFLPVIYCAGCDLQTKFFIGIISIVQIIMFSTTVPMILATEIPLSIRDMVIIWFERSVVGIVLAGIAVHIFF